MKKSVPFLYDSPTLIAVVFTFLQAMSGPLHARFGTVEKSLQGCYWINLFFPPLNVSRQFKYTYSLYSVCVCNGSCTHACLKEPGLNVNHQLPSAGWELSGKQLAANGRLMPGTAEGPEALVFREERGCITEWLCAGCSSVFFLPLYFCSKLPIRGRVRNLVG